MTNPKDEKATENCGCETGRAAAATRAPARTAAADRALPRRPRSIGPGAPSFRGIFCAELTSSTRTFGSRACRRRSAADVGPGDAPLPSGCIIGEVAGLMIGTVVGLSPWPMIVLATALSYVSGITLGLVPVIRNQHVGPLDALKIIWVGEVVSIGVMEIVMNFVDYQLGGMGAKSVLAWTFWRGLVFAVPAGFPRRLARQLLAAQARVESMPLSNPLGHPIGSAMAILCRLVALLAVLLMPLGMQPAAAAPRAAHAAMASTALPRTRRAPRQKGGFAECTMACSAALPREQTCRQRAIRRSRPYPTDAVVHGPFTDFIPIRPLHLPSALEISKLHHSNSGELIMMTLMIAAAVAAQPAPPPTRTGKWPECSMSSMRPEKDCCKDCCKDMADKHAGHAPSAAAIRPQ